ncbi:GtrA family protein [Sphingomonas changnyeongensis]|uniref:GtrA family protein n=1 Tax=Sphingomonas changnyeongensis TaxID=2698679 RepID=A0A7Z2NVD8_9SPHN|nr:GtrA family protein [Sphingomonas changnyeongensis]QHL90257.1 GtrA family protein [Sphingomonas changnyeongensis]
MARIPPEQRALYGQLVRFLITGGFVTLLGAAVYAVPAQFMGVPPLAANVLAYLVAALIGYVMHSRWSFRGHGRRDNVARTTGRFVIVSLVSFSLNSLWVWSLTDLAGGEPWWAVVPMVFVTPVVTFLLNRNWVFG